MIPTKTIQGEVDNLPVEREVAFSIGSPIWVMRSMSNLYSNKEGATAREYSTNARDAHIEAGKADVPIKVTLPSQYNPYFIVQDFGVGMSTDDLCDIYTKFGESTKRDSNEYNGMFGFGSKSAIAYTNQFTVVSIKDGIKSHAVISKREDWSITLKIVAVMPTDEDNGTTVTIPVHNPAEFAAKAKDFYRFWIPGTVEVDGKFPEQAVGEKIDDNLYFSPREGSSYVVMGNVAYTIPNPEALFRNARMKKISFVAYVPLGAVDHTPAREGLEFNTKTKSYLHKVIADFESKVIVETTKLIENAVTAQEAWTLWNFWGKKLGHNLFEKVTYKNKKFDRSFHIPDAIRYTVPYPNRYNERYNTRTIHSWDIDSMTNTLIVYDMTTEVTSVNKRKVKEFITSDNKQYNYVLFTKTKPDTTWIGENNLISWENLKAAIPKKPKVATAPRPKRPKGLFDFYIRSKFHSDSLIPTDITTVYYVTTADAKEFHIQDALEHLDVDDKTVVVKLAVNRIIKFVRDNPTAKDFVTYAKSKIELNGEKLLNDKAKRSMRIDNNTIDWLKAIDSTKIIDPLWAEYVELLSHRAISNEYNRNLELAKCFGMFYKVNRYNAVRDDYTITTKYPLLNKMTHNLSDDDKKDVILYINSKHEKGLK